MFDIDKYDSILTPSDIILFENDSIKNVIYRWEKGGYITNKQTNKRTNIEKIIKYSSSKGVIALSYYEYYYGDVMIGKETEYDEQGNITKIIDHEKGYKICHAQAIEIVKRRLRRQLAKYDSVSFILGRIDLNEYPGAKPAWSVGIVPEPDDAPGRTTYHRIDGATGKYLGNYTQYMVPDCEP